MKRTVIFLETSAQTEPVTMQESICQIRTMAETVQCSKYIFRMKFQVKKSYFPFSSKCTGFRHELSIFPTMSNLTYKISARAIDFVAYFVYCFEEI